MTTEPTNDPVMPEQPLSPQQNLPEDVAFQRGPAFETRVTPIETDMEKVEPVVAAEAAPTIAEEAFGEDFAGVDIEDDEVSPDDEPVSLEDLFGTDTSMERSGIWIDYGKAGKFLVACAGGANERYSQVMAAKAMPYRRQLQRTAKKGPDKKMMKLLRRLEMETYAEAVILTWQNVVLNGQVLEYSRENCLVLFRELPRLFDDLREQATDMMNFRSEEMDADAKN